MTDSTAPDPNATGSHTASHSREPRNEAGRAPADTDADISAKSEPLFEWVPNVSEGRDARRIDHLAQQIEGPGVRLIHQTSDVDHHRTVFTAIGTARGLTEGLLRLLTAAIETLDLQAHRGVHPRLGVVDVSPFVPLRGASIESAARLARGAAEKAGRLVPAYLYGAAASSSERAALVAHRRGGPEALRERVLRGDWLPDHHPRTGPLADPRHGVVLIGARHPLIAFNVELDAADDRPARRIAQRIRASTAGGLPGVLALGLRLPSRGTSQVSMNIVQPEATSLTTIVRRIQQEAADLGVGVLASELIGLLPRSAALLAARDAIGLAQLGEHDTIEHHL